MAASKSKKKYVINLVLMIIYLVVLMYFLFFAEGRVVAKTEDYRFNLHFFQEIMRFWKIRDRMPMAFLLNVVGNMVAFMPFGYLLPKLSKHCQNLFITVLFSLELSLCVEFIQLIFRLGCFDVDDLFLNTVGGLLGFVCYIIFDWRRNRVSVSEKT